MAEIERVDEDPNTSDSDTEQITERSILISESTATALVESQTPKSITAGPIVDEARKVQEKLQRFNEMRVLLVGKSGVGKSSFINCLFGRKVAEVGVVRPETAEVQPYNLKLENEGVTIKIYDTPGFGTSKKCNQKIIQEIQRVCELVDVIFLCFRMDDQFRAEDRQTVTLLAQKFKGRFWEKTLIIFTRANMVIPVGAHKESSNAEYLQRARDDLKEEIVGALQKAKVAHVPPFAIAGLPDYSPTRRMIPHIDVGDGSQDLPPDREDLIDWLPAVAIELFKSGCSENGKAILLKSGLGKWAQTGVYAGTSTGATVATLTGVGIVVVGLLLLPVPEAGIPIIATGSAVIAISLAVGGSSVAGFGAVVAKRKSSREKRIEEVMSEAMKNNDTET